ncbi:MAG TPA: sialidase family protein [Verrucomicrobiae bacterium]|nr:sialidase family protein [Verrucomicrobiae bacterium]
MPTPRQLLAWEAESVAFTGRTVAWATVPDGTFWRVVRSTDAGVRWRDVTPAGNDTSGGLDLSAITPDEAAVAFRPYGYQHRSAFALTVDGGARWQVGMLPGAAAGPSSMAVDGAGRLVAVLAGGRAVRSADGGQSWSGVGLPTLIGCGARTVRFVSRSVGWIGSSCRGRAGLWATADGGATWRGETLPVRVPRSALCAVAPPGPVSDGGSVTVALTAGADATQIAVVRWRGRRWQRLGALTLGPGRVIGAVAGSRLFVAKPAAAGTDSVELALSQDAGASWRTRWIPIPSTQVTGISITTAGVGLIVGQRRGDPRLWASRTGTTWSLEPLLVTARRTPPYGLA